jgi:hypothetical protein
MTTESDSLRVSLGVPESAVQDDIVPVTFRAENISTRTLTMYLLGRTPTLDVRVTNADGVEVWRRLEVELVPSILRVETLQPGGAVIVTEMWGLRTRLGESITPGRYSISAELVLESGVLRSGAVSLDILAR